MRGQGEFVRRVCEDKHSIQIERPQGNKQGRTGVARGRKGPEVSTFLRLALGLLSIARRICIRRVRDVHLCQPCAMSHMCAIRHIAVYVRYQTPLAHLTFNGHVSKRA